LATAAGDGPLDAQAARWLAKTAKLAPSIYEKLARAGLVGADQSSGRFVACQVQLIVQESQRIQFTDREGERRAIDVGNLSAATVKTLLVKLAALRKAHAAGITVDPDVAFADLPAKLRTKIAGTGLIAGRKGGAARTLAAFIDAYIADRVDVKKATKTVYGHVRRNLIDFFGERKDLAKITPRDGDRFRAFLKGTEKLGINTINKRCGIAKQFFEAAVKDRLLTVSPFEDLPAPAVKADRKKDRIIKEKDALAIIAKCPDAQWRAIFALSRWGGLRCPSEHLALRWEHVDWRRKRILVRSPKTEHLLGKESRVIPLFPELRTYLREVLAESPDDSGFVITRYRDSGTNLRTQLLKIIDRAGLKPWPNLFNNLRKTRENELLERYPSHVVGEWMGHTRAIAEEFYRRVTDDHFESAVTPGTTHGTTLQSSANREKRSQRVPQKSEKSPENTRFSGDRRKRRMVAVDQFSTHAFIRAIGVIRGPFVESTICAARKEVGG
jgi:integrase